MNDNTEYAEQDVSRVLYSMVIYLRGLPKVIAKRVASPYCLALLPEGFTKHPALPLNLVRSYRAFSPLPVPLDGWAIGRIFSVALSMGSLPPALRQAPYPVELGLSSPRRERPSVLLCNHYDNTLQIRMQIGKDKRKTFRRLLLHPSGIRPATPPSAVPTKDQKYLVFSLEKPGLFESQ